MPHQSIGDYGIIGNLHTVALSGKNGAIDWFCYPRFDSPSVFGAILDADKGGSFSIIPAAPAESSEQRYWPDTNVLITGFLSADGAGEVIDFMPLAAEDQPEAQLSIIRRVKVLRGIMAFRIKCHPAFNYGREEHRVELSGQGAVFHSASLSLALSSPIALKANERGIAGEFTLKEGEALTFTLRGITAGEGCGNPLSEKESLEQLRRTVEYWQRWISKCAYRGRWRETVQRSALALELLVYEPTGAVVAAPTCSLPEKIGGQRNWDYRYSWIRDASFTVYALLRIGLTDEADRFMEWLKRLCGELKDGGSLQTVYGIDARRELKEETLDHWSGYRDSGPVRIGNGAYAQLQLDIYGELIDAVYLYNKYRGPIDSGLWDDLRRLAGWVCENWQLEDQGIWEMRGPARPFVYSKVMCWVALDRVLRIGENRSLPGPRDKWLRCRDEIYEQVMQQGWNDRRQSFVQSYGSDSLDGSNLALPLVFFMAPADPKMRQTFEAICQPPGSGGLTSDGMVYRYDSQLADDGLKGDEGTFNLCTFWLVDALTRIGRTEPAWLQKAHLIFEKMLHKANHLGLYSEETGVRGELLGNFPQALAHLSLISAAVNLDSALDNRGSANIGDIDPDAT